ncbi:MAG: rhodanese-like domain-containing protein [Erythrobacter sp.]
MKLFKLAISTAALALSPALAAQERAEPPQAASPQIDYDAFAQLTIKLAPVRKARLLAKDEFFARAAQEDALILDTRSAAAFQMGHIKGAVNLPFSDFTDEKLRTVIGNDPTRAIYIYCNNNFSDNRAPIALKSAPLALNIPTFINLYGYGYENIWELDGVMATSEVNWVGLGDLVDPAPAQTATRAGDKPATKSS